MKTMIQDTIVSDAMTISKRTSDGNGFLTIKDSPITRVGVFYYLAKELGAVAKDFPPNQTVGLYRSEAEVFDTESMESFSNALVTDDHPKEMVSPKNHGEYSKGFVEGSVHREGDYLVGDLRILDAELINKIHSGKVELSNGYYSKIIPQEGNSNGEAYNFICTNIRGNHVAVVAKGRAGTLCRLSDSINESTESTESTESITKEPIMKNKKEVELNALIEEDAVVTKTYDHAGSTITASGECIEYIDSLLSVINDSATKLAEAQTTIALKDSTELTESRALLDTANAEIEELKAAILTDADIDVLVRERSEFLATASALAPTIVTDGLSITDIKREIVKLTVPTIVTDSASVETLDAVIAMLSLAPTTQSNSTLRNIVSDAAPVVKQKRNNIEEARRAR